MRHHAPHAHPVKPLPRAPDLPLPALRATATASRPATSRQTVPAVRIPPALSVRTSVTNPAWVPSSRDRPREVRPREVLPWNHTVHAVREISNFALGVM